MGEKIVKPDDHIEDISYILDNLREHPRKGIIHIGAHLGQEVETYLKAGFKKIILIEANPALCEQLEKKFSKTREVSIYNYAVADYTGEIVFYIHESRQGSIEPSSILKMKEFNKIVPTLHTRQELKVPCITLADFIEKNKIVIGDFSHLLLDIQGAEYKALKGGGTRLTQFKVVITEVCCVELYEEFVDEATIDALMVSHGFINKFTVYHELFKGDKKFPAWGEAVYIKQ
jgi:FkbM family methyltransferase